MPTLDDSQDGSARNTADDHQSAPAVNPQPETSRTCKPSGDEGSPDIDYKYFSIHAQATVVAQSHGSFQSPYVGPNSLLPVEPWRVTETSTLYLGARLWEGAALYFNPEISGGIGLGSTLGLAGFPNGEATRVGNAQPTPYIARLYFSQMYGFGGEQEKVEDDANQIAGMRDVERVTISFGKLGAPDSLDNNAYSHDPRMQFLNWSLMYNGAWDYPADTRGYTYGGVIDVNRPNWALRYGLFGEPLNANGPDIDPHFDHAHGQALEWEGRYRVADQPGKLRLMAYLNGSRAVHYREAIATGNLNLTPTGSYSNKYGFLLNWEQALGDDSGAFVRLGWNDGTTESWAFTEIDRTLALGLLDKGTSWCRPQDQVGTAVVFNGLSHPHRDFLAAGGIGFIIGDGRLNYGLEQIWENYYRCELKKGIYVTGDLQFVVNPAYNRDRGPVLIEGIRVHAEF